MNSSLPETIDTMHELTLEPGRTEIQYWRDLWRYRELFYFLSWRDILIRYKQTIAGVVWALLRPLLTMIVLTVVFGRIANIPSGGAPYPLLVLCGMLPWQLFSSALSESGNSLVNNASLISKVYFPRLVAPTSSVIVSFVDFMISMAIMAVLMVWYQCAPGVRTLALPLFLLLGFATSFGAGVWIAAMMVRYRDFRFIVPFIVQFGLYASPVGFASAAIPEKWRLLYSMNPMVGVIDGFRWSVLGGAHQVHWPSLLVSIGVSALLVFTGLWYFRKTERTFADII